MTDEWRRLYPLHTPSLRRSTGEENQTMHANELRHTKPQERVYALQDPLPPSSCSRHCLEPTFMGSQEGPRQVTRHSMPHGTFLPYHPSNQPRATKVHVPQSSSKVTRVGSTSQVERTHVNVHRGHGKPPAAEEGLLQDTE